MQLSPNRMNGKMYIRNNREQNLTTEIRNTGSK